MNKKEQAELDALKRELVIAKALHFSDLIKPDVPPPSKGFGVLSKGWEFNAYGGSVTVGRACSSSIHHGSGWQSTSSQGPIHLYSSRLLALKATRAVLARQCAESLAEVDLKIEDEKAQEQTK